jgi:hypothetical protein
MVSIPAAVLPIAVLPLVGYNPESATLGLDQPPTAMWYLKLLSGPVSTIFCVASFIVKLRFPLKTEQQVNAIGLGVALHVTGKAAPDPLSNCDPPVLYELVDIRGKEERHLANIVNHFPGPGVLRRMLGLQEDGNKVHAGIKFETTRAQEVNAQAKAVVKQVIYFVCILVVFAFLAFFCALGPPNLLESTNWSWICTVLMIIFGLSMVFTIGAALRRGASKKLREEHMQMSEDFLTRLLDNRQSMQDAGKKELGLTGTNPTKDRKAKLRGHKTE